MGGPKIDTSAQDASIAQQRAQAQQERTDQIREDTADATRKLLIRFGRRISTGQPAFGPAPQVADSGGQGNFQSLVARRAMSSGLGY